MAGHNGGGIPVKKRAAIAIALLMAFLLAFAAAESLSLDELVTEIDALSEDDKADIDGFRFYTQRKNTTFYVDERTFQENLLYIERYDLAREAFGGKPAFSYTQSGPSDRVSLDIRDILWEPGNRIAVILVYLAVDGDPAAIIPEEVAGNYVFRVTMTWGPIHASVEMTAVIKRFDGPPLTGLSVPEKYHAGVGEAYTLTVEPVPADWAFEGFTLSANISAGGDVWDHLKFTSDNSEAWPKLNITIDQEGVWEFYVMINASSKDGVDIMHHRTKIRALIGDAVDPETDTAAIHLCEREQWNYTFAGGSAVDLGGFCIVNREALSAALGGEPTVTCDTTHGPLGVRIKWQKGGSCEYGLYLTVDGDIRGRIPEDMTGEYVFPIQVKWGSLSTELIAGVYIDKVNPPLNGMTVTPGEIRADVGETVRLTLGTQPADWASDDYEIAFGADIADADRDRITCKVDGRVLSLTFSEAGVYSVRTWVQLEDGRLRYETAVPAYIGGATPEPVPLTLAEQEAVHEISPDKKSIFINKPTISGGTAPYTIAYNCYDADSNPVNYYYSDDARTAMSPGYNGRFNVFVVVRDSAGGEVKIDTGWQDLTGYEAQPLTVLEEVAVSEISPDGRSIFINRPTVSGGTGTYTYAYNCYDTDSQPVNYYYSDDWRTAMTPGYAGRFCVFVVVSDGVDTIIINTGWYELKK